MPTPPRRAAPQVDANTFPPSQTPIMRATWYWQKTATEWEPCALPPHGFSYQDLPHVMLLELRQALISYQDYHMLCFSSSLISTLVL